MEVQLSKLQVELASVRAEGWDIIVIGTGPAGSTAALHLASRGHRVLSIDRSEFPRDKTCGDGLLPDAISCLKRAGIYQDVQRFGFQMKKLSIFSPSGYEVEIPGIFFTLQRRIFDWLIAKRALESGAVLVRGAVRQLHIEPDGSISCIVAGSNRIFRAAVAIVATGTSLELLQNLRRMAGPQVDAIAMRCYFRSPVTLDRLIISFHKSIIPGYAWIFPLGNHEYNIGCGTHSGLKKNRSASLKNHFDSFLAQFPIAQEIVRTASHRSKLQGAMLRCGLRAADSVGPGNVLAVGETIGTTYHVSGEGIGKAMATAEIASQTIHEAIRSNRFETLRDYRLKLEKTLEFRYEGYRAVVPWLSKPWLIDLLARKARRSIFLQNAAVGMLNETVDPRTVFSARGMLLSLFS